MIDCSPRLRPLGAATISLLLLLCSGCSEMVSNAPSVTALNYDSHPAFPIGPGGGAHDKAVCDDCHGEFSTFKQFNCVSCHEHAQANTDPNHVGLVQDYTWSGTSCYSCHPDGKSTAVDHSTKFPIGQGTVHANISCNTCHVDPSNRKVVDCISCHTHDAATTDGIHNGIPNYAYTSPKCLECHPMGQITGIDHKSFPIGQGTVHTGLSCASCHLDRSNRKNVDCISCHTHEPVETNAIHANIPDYAYTSPKCLECHPQANIPGIDHTAFFPTEAGKTHAGISCRQCHPDRTNRTTLDCLTCHTSTAVDPKHSAVGGYSRSSPLCVRCHADSQVNTIAKHLPFLIRSGNRHNMCLTCHPNSRTDKPWGEDFVPFDCLGCHNKTETDGHHRNMSGYQYVSTTCVNSGCHPSGRAP